MHAWEERAGEAELVEAEEAVGEDDGGGGSGVVGAKDGVGVGYERSEGGDVGVGSRMGRTSGGEGSWEVMVDGRRALNEEG